MVNDPIEALEFASYYLFGPTQNLSDERIEQIKNVLVQQRNWVTAYANFRGDYSSHKDLPSDHRIQRIHLADYAQFDFIAYAVPKEGSFISVENICIPKASKKDEPVYRFINYITVLNLLPLITRVTVTFPLHYMLFLY